MLKSQIITNTWKCDNCGAEAVSEVNPNFSVSIQLSSMPNSPGCEIDLCETCIDTITVQPVVDYVASVVIA